MADTLQVQFKTPGKLALFNALDALFTAAGFGGFLPNPSTLGSADNGHYIAAGYRLDWHFFTRIVTLLDLTKINRGLHCDVLVTRLDPTKPTIQERVAAIKTALVTASSEDHDTPSLVLIDYGVSVSRVWVLGGGVRLIKTAVMFPGHTFLAVSKDDAVSDA